MDKIQSFDTFTQMMSKQNEDKALQEKGDLQQKYADFFKSLLQKYDVTSPADLDDAKKSEFFDDVSKGWSEGSGITDAGKQMVGESSDEETPSEEVKEEAEINSDEEFAEYAKKVLKQSHGDDYDEAKAQSTIDGLLAKKEGDDYGAIIGMLNKG